MVFGSDVDDNVRLDVPQARVDADTLRLTYEVANRAEASIYVLNGLFHRRGAQGWVVDPNLVYSSVDDSRVLHLRKHMIDVPEDIDVEYPEVPFATEVLAGDAYRETIVVPVPVTPHDPYRPQGAADVPYEVESVVFTIGYVVDDGSFEKGAPSAQGAEGMVRLAYSDVRRLQRLKSAGPLPARVATVATGRR